MLLSNYSKVFGETRKAKITKCGCNLFRRIYIQITFRSQIVQFFSHQRKTAVKLHTIIPKNNGRGFEQLHTFEDK